MDTQAIPAISQALRHVKMSGVFYCPSELTEPWGLAMPATPNTVWFHAVTSGRGHIEVEGTTHAVHTGDLVLVPHGTGHRVWGADEAPTPSVFDLPHEYHGEHYAILRHGGGGAQTTVVCGGISFDHPAARHLIDALPEVIHIEAAHSTRSDWMQATLDLMAEETQHPRPGGEAVVSRLCDIVVIQAIRTWIERDPAAQTGWLGALQDDQIGAAIARMHTEPAHAWTLKLLAAEASMSRSAFAARFTEMVGEPAMGYLTRWRMMLAIDLLQSGDLPVAAVAAQVGYASEAAFSRAFKRVMGLTPRSARRADVSSANDSG